MGDAERMNLFRKKLRKLRILENTPRLSPEDMYNVIISKPDPCSGMHLANPSGPCGNALVCTCWCQCGIQKKLQSYQGCEALEDVYKMFHLWNSQHLTTQNGLQIDWRLKAEIYCLIFLGRAQNPIRLPQMCPRPSFVPHPTPLFVFLEVICAGSQPPHSTNEGNNSSGNYYYYFR